MKVSELKEKFGFTYGSGTDAPDREVNGCYIGDLLSLAMAKVDVDNAWITIMSNINVIAVATLADTACVILAENVELPEDVKSQAEMKDVNVLKSPLPIYETAVRLYGLLS